MGHSPQPPAQPRYIRLIALSVSVVLLCLSFWAISRELHQYSLQTVFQILGAMPSKQLASAIALVALNYAMLTGYDTLAVRFVHHPLPYRKTALAALLSYAISNTVGLAFLSSSAIRLRLYTKWGFSVSEVAQIIAFCNLSFWLGLLSVGGVMFLLDPFNLPNLFNQSWLSLRSLGAVFLAVTLAYLIWSAYGTKALKARNFILPHLPLNLALAQIAVTSIDWAIAAGVMYALLPNPIPLPYLNFFGIYLLAQLSGIVSNVPGGLGVFESVIVLSLSPTLPSATLLATSLAYRGIYYFLPLLIAAMTLGLYEVRSHLR